MDHWVRDRSVSGCVPCTYEETKAIVIKNNDGLGFYGKIVLEENLCVFFILLIVVRIPLIRGIE